MKDRTKNIIITITFLIIVIGVFFINIIVKDKNISIAERRRLSKFPKVNMERILNGKFFKEFETYAMDQFILRDELRNIKAITNFNILNRKDNNGYFIKDDIIYKQIDKLKEDEIKKASLKIKSVKDKYLKKNKVYYSIVPDKTYFSKNNDLKIDYKKLEKIMFDNLKNENIKYIPIFDELNIEDYYKTDTHWKQTSIVNVAKKISNAMDNTYYLSNVKVNKRGNFNGVYYGQVGLKLKQNDELFYITNDAINNATTYNVETKKVGKIYDEEKWKKSNDKYDFFLSGATPIIEINRKDEKENKEDKLKLDKKELIIFRDSFGSSIAPLFIEEYSKITLVDLRYISSDYLSNFIDFKDQDVLFLYSTLILNDATVLK